ncbi:MAG TPA: sigma-54 dependent transcriptional regulator [Acidobacteriaceae bacterium]|nr:sigma-54 dependent transcriptional regulator [Acidobacteriaceae bacterium]
MNLPMYHVLVVDDEPAVARYIAGLLPQSKFKAQVVNSGQECLKKIQSKTPPFDMILMDSEMPGVDGFSTLRRLRRFSADTPVIIMSCFSSPEHTLEAWQGGAQDFLQKPILPSDIARVVEKYCKKPKRAMESEGPQQPHIEDIGEGQFFLATSPEMRAIWRQVNTLSKADVPVLITGESGVGKEVIAQLLHQYSPRASRQLLKVNCAALPQDLLESELFGYEAGAFTGAIKSKPGKFELCDGGTILLDEIGEMSPQLQAKLLHVLQDGTFSRLGARVNTKVNVRVLAATNVDIEQAIAERRFREDLYYRLNAFVIKIPPLRERREEIPYFLNELARRYSVIHGLEPIEFSPELIAAAVLYHWPGNLRELGNFVKRYLVIRDAESALVDLEAKIRPHAAASPALASDEDSMPGAASGLKSVVRSMKDQTESRMILEVLDQSKWNRRIAAERLQISYKALLYKIRMYNLEASA